MIQSIFSQCRCDSDSVKNNLTIELYVAVEVTDASVHVYKSICYHRTHCLRQEKIVELCELTFNFSSRSCGDVINLLLCQI